MTRRRARAFDTIPEVEAELYRTAATCEDLRLMRRGFLADLQAAIARGDRAAVKFCDERLMLIEAALSRGCGGRHRLRWYTDLDAPLPLVHRRRGQGDTR